MSAYLKDFFENLEYFPFVYILFYFTLSPQSNLESAMSNLAYSDLEVVNRSNIPAGLEYYQPTQSNKPLLNISTGSDTYKEVSYLPPDERHKHVQPIPRKRLCGVRLPIFWTVVAAIGIIIVGAVVGGVVGSSSRKDTTTKAAPSTESLSPSNTNQPTESTPLIPTSSTTTSGHSSTITSTPSLTNSITTTTTSIIGASTTLLSDCPSSNNTLYQINSNYFRKFCRNDLASNRENVINIPTSNLDDCIELCNAYNIQNGTEIAGGSSNVCNAVCWRATIDGDDHPGQCFGFTTTNSSNAFVFEGDMNCNSAAWINEVF